MAKTLKAFMQTEAFRRAAQHTGNSRFEDFEPDGDNSGRMARKMSGAYTVAEIDACHEDMRLVQAAFDAWDGEPDPTMPHDVESTLVNALRVAADRFTIDARALDKEASDTHSSAEEKAVHARMAKQFRKQTAEVNLMIDAIARDGLHAFVTAHVPND